VIKLLYWFWHRIR